jgi:hypothetical protein
MKERKANKRERKRKRKRKGRGGKKREKKEMAVTRRLSLRSLDLPKINLLLLSHRFSYS